jgi:hypothetical protein
MGLGSSTNPWAESIPGTAVADTHVRSYGEVLGSGPRLVHGILPAFSSRRVSLFANHQVSARHCARTRFMDFWPEVGVLPRVVIPFLFSRQRVMDFTVFNKL